MLRGEVEPSFSDLWYRVTQSRPRLSPHAHVTRQHYGPEIAYIVEDPAGGHYYRLSEAAYFFLGLLDGRTTVDEAWEAACEQLGDAAPTQRECIHLLAQLQLYGLLLGGEPISPDMLEQRVKRMRSERFQQRTGRFVFPHIPLINPEPWLERHKGLCRAIFSKFGAAVWIVAAAVALAMVLPRWRLFASELNGLLDPRNLIWMSVLFLLIRVVHELGHAMAAKAMGGRCTEIGLIMIALILPLPYCEASSAWRMPEIWRRVLISGAGMLYEMFLAAIAGILWAVTSETDAQLLHALAYNVMIIASVTTLVFNLNPLLRYDGYYMLSDIAGVPNLAMRSRQLWRYLFERHAFGLRGITPPRVRDRAELWLLIVYGMLSPFYRIFIGLSILLVVASMYLTLGLVLAAVIGVLWFVWPLLKGAGYLASSPRLIGRRGRAVGISAAAALAGVVLLGFVPLPAAAHAPGVIEPAQRAVLRTREAGFVATLAAGPGEVVEAGQVVLVLENPELQRDLRKVEAELRRTLIELDMAAGRSEAHREVAEQRVRSLREQAERARRRVAALTVRSPIEGRVAPYKGSGADLESIPGMYVERGEPLAQVVQNDRLVLEALLSDRERSWVFRAASDDEIAGAPAAIRVRGDAGRTIPAKIVHLAPAAQRRLSKAALAQGSGGEVAMDPSDANRQRTLVPHFIVEVAPLEQHAHLQPGLRGRVRFDAGREPAAQQLWRRVRQYLDARFDF